MIAWLKGTIIELDDNEVVIDANGVGYQVQVGDNLRLKDSLKIGDEAELAIYTSAKEDGIRLFGFKDFYTRKVFILLLNVNGVGPKVALNIVDQLGPGEIVKALRESNAHAFVKVSGVGKKTAQRIVLDLQGKMELIGLSAQVDNEFENIGDSIVVNDQQQIYSDAVSALSNLGFTVKASEKVISKYLTPDASLDDLIRRCLSDLKKMA